MSEIIQRGHFGARPAQAVRPGNLYRLARRRSTVAFLFALPLLLVLGGLIVYPGFYAIYLSMLNKAQTKFIGFGNYAFLFTRDTFWAVVEQSVIFAVTAVILKALLGIVTAHLVNNLPAKGQRKWRGMLLMPWVIPVSLSTLGWFWLLDPTYSAFNWALALVHGPEIPWLSDPVWARISTILVNVWFGSPFFLIMYLAALKSVPEQLYEAAAIDGANAWQKLVHITLPMMRNIISITVLFSLIVTFANYDIVRVLTNGGPRNSTHVFATWAFQLGIASGDIPLGASVSLFMFPILGISAIFILRGVRRRGREILMTSVTADALRPFARGSSLRRNRRWALVMSYCFLVLFAIFFLTPPFYQLVTATKSSSEISMQQSNPWLPSLHPTLENLDTLWNHTDFPIYLRNSAMVTVLVVIITMLIAVPAAFALGRMKFWGSGILATGVFLTYLVPDSLLFIPLFKIVGGLGLLNSYWALVLVYPTLTVPFCTWIMIGYFQSIPRELDEAALIDGASHLQMLFKIFIPVALPGLIAATIFAFTVSWAEFVYPMAFLYSSNQMVLTVGTVTTLVKGDVYQWGMIMTAALIAAAPPLVIYAFLMDYYIAGLTAGATKG